MGTIVDKFNYSFEAKDLIKDSINNLGGSITSETELKEYAQELDNIYDNLPKTTGEDTNLSLTTLKGKMNIIPKGDTQQTQYSGYNKINTTNATIGYKPEGTTITIDSKGVINASTNVNYASINLPSMTLSSGKTYTFKRNFTGSYNSYLVDTNGENILVIGYNATSKTITPESDVTINKLNGALVSGDNYFWLYEGTTDKSFEPYVGGTASPNPTYPQNIEVVTGTQEVKVENVNLLNYNAFVKGRINSTTGQIEYAGNTTNITTTDTTISFTTSQAWNSGITSDYIPIEQGSYTYSIKNATLKASVYIDLYDKDKNYLTRQGNKVINASEVTTWTTTISNTSAKYIRLHYEIGYADTITLTETQLQKGSTATPYTPHQEQTQTISLGDIELCKIGNYQDYLYKSNDKWYKKAQIGKQIFTGASSEYWNTSGTSTSGYNRFTSGLLYNLILKPTATSQIADIMSNYFIKKSADNTYAKIEGISVGTNGNLYIYADSLKEYTKEQFITWLSTHNMEVRYVLATPQDIEITNSSLIQQLDNLEKMYSYNGITNISSSGNLPIVLGVSALKGES